MLWKTKSEVRNIPTPFDKMEGSNINPLDYFEASVPFDFISGRAWLTIPENRVGKTVWIRFKEEVLFNTNSESINFQSKVLGLAYDNLKRLLALDSSPSLKRELFSIPFLSLRRGQYKLYTGRPPTDNYMELFSDDQTKEYFGTLLYQHLSEEKTLSENFEQEVNSVVFIAKHNTVPDNRFTFLKGEDIIHPIINRKFVYRDVEWIYKFFGFSSLTIKYNNGEEE